MNRRDSLKLLMLAAAAGASPARALALASGEAEIVIFDGRFAEGRAFAWRAAQAFDCQGDAAALWFARFAGRASLPDIAGLTGAADAMILADCARREGRAFARHPSTPTARQLIAWTITSKQAGPRSPRDARREKSA